MNNINSNIFYLLPLIERIVMSLHNWEKSVEKYIEQRKNRNLVIYGTDLFSKEIIRTVKYLGIPIYYVIGEQNEFEGINVISPSDLITLDKKVYFILAPVLSGHKEIYENLVALGYELKKDFSVMGIGGYTELLNAIDSLLMLNRVNDGMPGFKKYSADINAYRIVVLGNSTSDPTTGNIKCWSEYLFDRCNENQMAVEIYCGAMTGYSSTQEYLKLSRDVINLSPDLVISFSGYNDIKENSTVDKYPFLHKYQKKFYDFLKHNHKLAPDSMYVRNITEITHGIPSDEKDYDIWINNMRKMKAICSEFKIDFLAFLQPMVEYMKPGRSKAQKEIISEFYRVTNSAEVEKATVDFCEKAIEKMQEYPYMINFTDIFLNENDVFYDTCHCNEKGNYIIAEEVYKKIEYLIERQIKP